MSSTAVERVKAQWQGKVAGYRAKARQGIDTAEITVGAAIGGYIDVTLPEVAGVPTAAAVGIATYVAGMVMEQRDLSMLGTGLLAAQAAKQGAALALDMAAKRQAAA